MSKPLLFSLLTLFASQVAAYDFREVAEKHILPAYRQLATDAARLESATREYCAAPKGDATRQLRDAYVRAFLAWQGAQHIRFGPVQYLSREHGFALWPDKRGTVGKHLTRLLDDPVLHVDAFDISQKSVAVQGFSALERLLYDRDLPNVSECRVIVAISINLRTMADELVRDWSQGNDAYVGYFSEPGAGNPVYESAGDLAGQHLNNLHTELELVVTQKLARPLGSDIEKARGKRAEGWRSGASLAAISANLHACLELYRYTFAPELNNRPPARAIERVFERARVALGEIEQPLGQAVTDPGQRALVERLHADLSALAQLVARDLASTLNLSLGFNSLDGD